MTSSRHGLAHGMLAEVLDVGGWQFPFQPHRVHIGVEIGKGDDAAELVFARHDRQPSNVVLQHQVQCIVQGRFFQGDNGRFGHPISGPASLHPAEKIFLTRYDNNFRAKGRNGPAHSLNPERYSPDESEKAVEVTVQDEGIERVAFFVGLPDVILEQGSIRNALLQEISCPCGVHGDQFYSRGLRPPPGSSGNRCWRRPSHGGCRRCGT